MRTRIGRTIDCESELSTGEFLVTSNAQAAAKVDAPPSFHTHYLPQDTPHLEVVALHRRRLAEFLAVRPGASVTAIYSLPDALALQERILMAKVAYRRDIGYTNVQELMRYGCDAQTAAAIQQALVHSSTSPTPPPAPPPPPRPLGPHR